MLEVLNPFEGSRNTPKEQLQKLTGYLEKGYYLHGSPAKILGEIEPRQAHDISGESHKNLKAVYATTELVPAIISALFHREDDAHVSWEGFENGEYYVTGKGVSIKTGYVYVLSPRQFKTLGQGSAEGAENVSQDGVAPTTIVTVTPEILELLPNLKIELNESN